MFLGVYKAGATVRFRGNFHNDAGALENPTSPAATREDPTGAWTALPAPAQINALTGHYGASIDTTGFATGQHTVNMSGTVTVGKAVATEFCFEIVAFDPTDGVRLGLTALPNAAAAANGGLPTVDAANSVKIQSGLKKNTALPNFTFLMTDSASHLPKTGLAVTATRRIDAGAFGATTNAPTEVANGVYTVDLSAADLNGTVITLRLVAPGADDLEIQLEPAP